MYILLQRKKLCIYYFWSYIYIGSIILIDKLCILVSTISIMLSKGKQLVSCCPKANNFILLVRKIKHPCISFAIQHSSFKNAYLCHPCCVVVVVVMRQFQRFRLPCHGVIHLKCIHNFLCSMLVFTPFA
jgi:hypothetical protein